MAGRRGGQKEEGASATQEIKAFAKSLLTDITEEGRKMGGLSELVYKTRVKCQNVLVSVDVLQFVDGQIDVRLDQSNVVNVYRHEIIITPGAANVTKVRAILTRGDLGRAEDGKEVLCGDNWSMTSNGLILSMRFSGRHPADAAGLISEPAQPTIDLAAESGATASEFVRWMKKIEKLREDAEAAALEHSELTYEERKEKREREAAEKEEREERTRPQRLWNAVKEGKAKAVTEVLDRPFVRTAPPKPLVHQADDAGWTLLHWAAFKNHREVCTVLLRYNADVLARDCSNSTPFHLASSNGAEEVCVFLMDRMTKHDGNWSLNVANDFGSTALIEAACNGHNVLAGKLYAGKCDWRAAKKAEMTNTQDQVKDSNPKDSSKRLASENKDKHKGSSSSNSNPKPNSPKSKG